MLKKVLPEVPDPPKKSTRRQRKRRNPNKSKFKSMMDDSSETSSTSDLSTKSDSQPEKTIIYTPLSLYLKLNLNMYALYHEFTHHLLTRDQLKMYGFPEEVPGRPGRAVMRTQNVTRGCTERRCCRCGSVFNILQDGRYVADTFCRYHSRKQLPYRKGHPYNGDYPCCNGSYMSEGCVTWQYHVTAESALHDVEFVKTKSKKHLNEVTAGTVYALDCEMLYTTAGMEVAKVGIVGADGLTVFESFVLPQNQILDYNTVYSGVTEKDLKGVTMTLVDVQTYMLKLLNKESILVGHGLENDLKALRLIHNNVVDTSVAFPFKHTKFHKRSLKSIAQEILSKEIQQSTKGHNCIEDARTCMELMLHKIHSDLEARPTLIEDENKNSILQNITLPVDYNTTSKYTEYSTPWPYSCNFACYSNSSFSSGYLMPKNYNNCIYG